MSKYYQSDEPEIQKYQPDKFIEKNFDQDGVDFRSYLENGTITRKISEKCYTKTNNIENLYLETVSQTFSTLVSGEGRLMEHAPIYYGFYQPLVTGKALETEESQNYEHNRFKVVKEGWVVKYWRGGWVFKGFMNPSKIF